MATELLGRTNRAFPPVWLSLATPTQPLVDRWSEELVGAALNANTVVDISSNPGLWGGQMRGTDACLMARGGLDIRRAAGQTHACDLVQAHFIETLSAIGREYVDFYFLRVSQTLQEFQIQGALEALEDARQDGHIRYLGLSCEGDPLSVLGLWQFHDAFDVLLVPRSHDDSASYETLAPLARERRVGIVTSQPLHWGYGVSFDRLPVTDDAEIGLDAIADLAREETVLVDVRTPDEVRRAVEAGSRPASANFHERLERYRRAFQDEAVWETMREGQDAALRQAAERRASAFVGGAV